MAVRNTHGGVPRAMLLCWCNLEPGASRFGVPCAAFAPIRTDLDVEVLDRVAQVGSVEQVLQLTHRRIGGGFLPVPGGGPIFTWRSSTTRKRHARSPGPDDGRHRTVLTSEE